MGHSPSGSLSPDTDTVDLCQWSRDASASRLPVLVDGLPGGANVTSNRRLELPGPRVVAVGLGFSRSAACGDSGSHILEARKTSLWGLLIAEPVTKRVSAGLADFHRVAVRTTAGG